MTNHPCQGLSRAARSAFEQIAVNAAPTCTWHEIDELMAAGLILFGPYEIRHDAMGLYRIPSFAVPIGIHAQWCAWCSESQLERCDDETASDQAIEGQQGGQAEQDQDRTDGGVEARRQT